MTGGSGAWTAQRREAESETHLRGAERGHAGDEGERGTREAGQLVIIAASPMDAIAQQRYRVSMD